LLKNRRRVKESLGREDFRNVFPPVYFKNERVETARQGKASLPFFS